MEKYQEQKSGNINSYGSQVAVNGGKIEKSKIKFKDKTKTDNRVKVSTRVYWYAAASGFVGGVLASLVAAIIVHFMKL